MELECCLFRLALHAYARSCAVTRGPRHSLTGLRWLYNLTTRMLQVGIASCCVLTRPDARRGSDDVECQTSDIDFQTSYSAVPHTGADNIPSQPKHAHAVPNKVLQPQPTRPDRVEKRRWILRACNGSPGPGRDSARHTAHTMQAHTVDGHSTRDTSAQRACLACIQKRTCIACSKLRAWLACVEEATLDEVRRLTVVALGAVQGKRVNVRPSDPLYFTEVAPHRSSSPPRVRVLLLRVSFLLPAFRASFCPPFALRAVRNTRFSRGASHSSRLPSSRLT